MTKHKFESTVIGLHPALGKTVGLNSFYKAALVEDFPQMVPGTINLDDAKSLDGINLLNEVIQAQRTVQVLTGACRFKPTAQMLFKMRVQGLMEAHEKVAEFQEADITKNLSEPISFELWKNMVHIAASDEAQMQPETAYTIYTNARDAGNALAFSKDKQIAEELLRDPLTFTASGTWDDSTVNPYKDINAILTKIRKAKCGFANVAVANSRVWTSFFSLDKVNGVLKGVEPHLAQNTFTVPTLPGMTCYSTDQFETDGMLIANKDLYCTLAQGPYTAEDYRASAKGYDGWLVRDYMQAKKTVGKAGIVLTDILS